MQIAERTGCCDFDGQKELSDIWVGIDRSRVIVALVVMPVTDCHLLSCNPSNVTVDFDVGRSRSKLLLHGAVAIQIERDLTMIDSAVHFVILTACLVAGFIWTVLFG